MRKCKRKVEQTFDTDQQTSSIWQSFYTGYVYSDFMFFFDRLEIILGGEGGYLDWFFIRLLARDPPSEVGSMQR